MNHFFQSSVTPPATRPSSALWFALKENRVLLHATGNELCVPQLEDFEQLNIEYAAVHYLGTLGESHCYAVQLSADNIPAGMAFKDLRSAMMVLDESFGALAGRAFQIIQWDRTHQFCGQCGGRTDAAGRRTGQAVSTVWASAVPTAFARHHRAGATRQETVAGPFSADAARDVQHLGGFCGAW